MPVTDTAEMLALAGAARQLEALDAGEITSAELVEQALRGIERLNPQLNAFAVVFAQEARAAAVAADERRAAGERAPLLGLPIAIKDDVEQAGQVTTFGSAAAEGASPADSEVLARLRRAGAVVVGRTVAPELLIWPYTESDTWGVTRNPWDLERTPGGSSGGSAAAVASGIVGLALGSDGGGSIRIPAACCGVFGLKTSRGLIPIAPHTDADHAWQGLAVYGPLARTVRDAALFLDAAAEPPAAGSYLDACSQAPHRLRIGLTLRGPLPGPVSREAKAVTREIARVLEQLGHEVVPVSPRMASVVPNFLVRFFTGIARSAAALPHPERLDARTRRMARIGDRIPATVLARVRRGETRVAQRVNRVFDEVDIVLSPALAGPPKRAGRMLGKGVLRTLNDAALWTPFSQIWNVVGQPAAAVPAGMTRDGVPLAVQLAGRAGDDALLLALSAQLEAARPWQDRLPPVAAGRERASRDL